MIINLRVSPALAIIPEYLERLIANGIAFAVESFPSLDEEIVKTKVDWKAFNCELGRKVARSYLAEPKKRNEMLCFSYFLNVAGEFECVNLYETGYSTLDDQSMKIPTLWDYAATQIQNVVDYGIEGNPVLSNLSPNIKDLIMETANHYANYNVVPEKAGMFGDANQVIFMTGFNNEALYAGVLKNISEQYKNGTDQKEAAEEHQETGE